VPQKPVNQACEEDDVKGTGMRVVALVVAGCGDARLGQDRGAPTGIEPTRSRGTGMGEPGLAELPKDPTLDDLIVYAEQNNAGLRAARGRWEAALEAGRAPRSCQSVRPLRRPSRRRIHWPTTASRNSGLSRLRRHMRRGSHARR